MALWSFSFRQSALRDVAIHLHRCILVCLFVGIFSPSQVAAHASTPTVDVTLYLQTNLLTDIDVYSVKEQLLPFQSEGAENSENSLKRLALALTTEMLEASHLRMEVEKFRSMFEESRLSIFYDARRSEIYVMEFDDGDNKKDQQVLQRGELRFRQKYNYICFLTARFPTALGIETMVEKILRDRLSRYESFELPFILAFIKKAQDFWREHNLELRRIDTKLNIIRMQDHPVRKISLNINERVMRLYKLPNESDEPQYSVDIEKLLGEKPSEAYNRCDLPSSFSSVFDSSVIEDLKKEIKEMEMEGPKKIQRMFQNGKFQNRLLQLTQEIIEDMRQYDPTGRYPECRNAYAFYIYLLKDGDGQKAHCRKNFKFSIEADDENLVIHVKDNFRQLIKNNLSTTNGNLILMDRLRLPNRKPEDAFLESLHRFKNDKKTS